MMRPCDSLYWILLAVTTALTLALGATAFYSPSARRTAALSLLPLLALGLLPGSTLFLCPHPPAITWEWFRGGGVLKLRMLPSSALWMGVGAALTTGLALRRLRKPYEGKYPVKALCFAYLGMAALTLLAHAADLSTVAVGWALSSAAYYFLSAHLVSEDVLARPRAAGVAALAAGDTSLWIAALHPDVPFGVAPAVLCRAVAVPLFCFPGTGSPRSLRVLAITLFGIAIYPLWHPLGLLGGPTGIALTAIVSAVTVISGFWQPSPEGIPTLPSRVGALGGNVMQRVETVGESLLSLPERLLRAFSVFVVLTQPRAVQFYLLAALAGVGILIVLVGGIS